MLDQMEIRVRYSEAERNGKAGLFQILQYFQDLATFQCRDLGYGVYEDVMKDRAWFLLAYEIKVKRYPEMFEQIRIRTNPYKIQRAYGYRAFEILDESGDVIVEADSLWVFMNTDKLLPVRVPESLEQSFQKVRMERKKPLKRKIRLPEDLSWSPVTEFPITKVYLDTNSHVNNAYYGLWTELLLPPEENYHFVRIDYRKAALAGDQILVSTARADGARYYKYENQEGQLLAVQQMSD